MGKQEDWEELEKWQKEQEKKRIEDYGMNVVQPKFQKVRKKTVAVAKVLDKFAWAVCYALLAIVVLIGIEETVKRVYSWRIRTQTEVIETIQTRYGKELINLSEEKEKGERGLYLFALKEKPELQFHAFKDSVLTLDDYEDCCHKYFFEQWQHEAKSSFSVTEEYKDGLLEYETNMIIHKEEERQKAEEIIQQFIEYAGPWYSKNWKIEIKKSWW